MTWGQIFTNEHLQLDKFSAIGLDLQYEMLIGLRNNSWLLFQRFFSVKNSVIQCYSKLL